MKQIFSILLISICFSGIAAAGEITYFNKPWAEIKAKAKAEGKYIFIDCYTEWCGWCKVMDKETMIDNGIITTLNDKFVSVKMDMEHGEGVKLAMKYHISGYPTFMFFNPQGELVYTSVGYQKPKEFTEEIKNALDKSKQTTAPGYTASIDLGFPAFYDAAFGERAKAKRPTPDEVTAFLDKQTDLFSEVSWGVISRFEMNEKYTKYFFDNIKKYEQLYGSSSAESKVNGIIMSKERTAVKNKSTADFDAAMQLVDKYVKKDAEETKLNMRLDYYKDTKDWDKYMTAFADIIKKPGYDDPNYINSQCWSLYENCDNKKALTQACAYMAKAVEKEPKYANMDTYAALLYKSGQLTEAETWANKAITTGKQEGEKTESTEELLKKIKTPEAKSGNGAKS